MKKSILAISLLGSLAILSTGCGSSSESSSTTVYDLSQYSLPSQNQINNYVEETYENDEGKKDYSNSPDSEGAYAQKYEIDGTTVKEYRDNILETTYTIQSNKIVEVDAQDNSSINVTREVKEGDTIISINKTLQQDSITMTFKNSCKLSDHLNSKEIKGTTYNDVIEVKCEGTVTSPEGAQVGGLPFSISSENTNFTYFAKGKGMILDIEEYCSTTILNNAESKECEKEITEITTIN